MSPISRRDFLSGAQALAAGAIVLPASHGILAQKQAPAAASHSFNGPALRQIAAQKGIVYGAATQKSILQKDPVFGGIFAQQCERLVPEWELKFGTVEPRPHSFDFSLGDWLVNYAMQHNMQASGGGLIWHSGLPDWFQSYMNKGNARQVMVEYITRTLQHFAGKTHGWVVVNEVFDTRDNRADGLRVTRSGYWYALMGTSYIETAFRTAAAADPHQTLIWNVNYVEEEDNPLHMGKRAAILKWFADFKKRNVPLHVLGIQSHMTAGRNLGGPNFQNFLHSVADLGYKIYITEIDVNDSELPGDIATRDQKVADTYYRYLTAALKEKAVTSVISWGLCDKYSWLKGDEKRKDGQSARPLLLDENLQPKKAYYAVQRAFSEAASR